MSLRGSRKRPWLELRRNELDLDFLRHQARTLQRLHPGTLQTVWDEIPHPDGYSDFRVRMQGDGLWPAYELMYPRDKKVVTGEILHTCGEIGFITLLLDRGHFKGDRITLPCRDIKADLLLNFAHSLGYPFRNNEYITDSKFIRIRGYDALAFVRSIKKLVHPSMRKVIKPILEGYGLR